MSAARHRLDWIVPVHEPMILISQVQRAGGTLLARLFDDHPACFAHPYELKWGYPKKWDWPNFDPNAPDDKLLRGLKESWVAEFAPLGFYQKHILRPKNRALEGFERQPFIFDRELQDAVFRACLPVRPRTSSRGVLDAHLTALFNAWLDYQNLYRGPKQYVTAFVPRLNMYPASRQRFWRDYPDGYLVTLIREPLSWLASALRHTNSGPLSELNSAIDLWLDSTAGSMAALDERPERTVVLMFEDVVRYPTEVTKLLAERFGLEWLPSLTRPTYNGRPVASDSSFIPSTIIDASSATRQDALDEDVKRQARMRTADAYDEARRRFALKA